MKRNCDRRNTFMSYWFIMLFLGTVPGGCHSRPAEEAGRISAPRDLVKLNQYLVKKDQATISSFIARKGWDMKSTSTGLRYIILSKGTGPQAQKGNVISLKYTVSLLDGTVIYSSDSLGLKTFRIGQGNVEAGLEEGVMLLHKGDRARFILAPYLAFGLIGDNDKIPGRTIIVYEIEVTDIKTG